MYYLPSPCLCVCTYAWVRLAECLHVCLHGPALLFVELCLNPLLVDGVQLFCSLAASSSSSESYIFWNLCTKQNQSMSFGSSEDQGPLNKTKSGQGSSMNQIKYEFTFTHRRDLSVELVRSFLVDHFHLLNTLMGGRPLFHHLQRPATTTKSTSTTTTEKRLLKWIGDQCWTVLQRTGRKQTVK